MSSRKRSAPKDPLKAKKARTEEPGPSKSAKVGLKTLSSILIYVSYAETRENRSSGFPDRFDTLNRAVQTQEIARGWKVKELYYSCSENEDTVFSSRLLCRNISICVDFNCGPNRRVPTIFVLEQK